MPGKNQIQPKPKKKGKKRPDDQKMKKRKDFGGIPDVDFKKMLGCGG